MESLIQEYIIGKRSHLEKTISFFKPPRSHSSSHPLLLQYPTYSTKPNITTYLTLGFSCRKTCRVQRNIFINTIYIYIRKTCPNKTNIVIIGHTVRFNYINDKQLFWMKNYNKLQGSGNWSQKKSHISRQIHLFLASFRKLLLSWLRLKW